MKLITANKYRKPNELNCKKSCKTSYILSKIVYDNKLTMCVCEIRAVLESGRLTGHVGFSVPYIYAI